MKKFDNRPSRQLPDTKQGRIRRDTRRAVIASKRAWLADL